MQIKFKLKLKMGDIDLISERPISDEELESIRKEIEPISKLLLLGDETNTLVEVKKEIENYITDRKNFLLCMGEYKDQKALESDLELEGFIFDNNYIYKKSITDDNKIARFNFLGRWLELSPKLKQLPVPLIWAFPATFSIWYDQHYTTMKECREWTSIGLIDIDLAKWTKDK